MITLYRDDDINRYTDITLFTDVHNLFNKHNKLHTVAVEMEDLWENKAIWFMLVTIPNIKIGLHGWRHKDYSIMSYADIVADINRSLDYWYTNVKRGYGEGALSSNKTITTFYPPWNKVSENLIHACRDTKLNLDNRHTGEVYNFHWWACSDVNYMNELDRILKQ